MVINEQQYSVGTQGIRSGGQYSFDLSCKFYNMAIISKEIRWDATAQQKGCDFHSVCDGKDGAAVS